MVVPANLHYSGTDLKICDQVTFDKRVVIHTERGVIIASQAIAGRAASPWVEDKHEKCMGVAISQDRNTLPEPGQCILI